jgi:large subunit ribosomal protein L21
MFAVVALSGTQYKVCPDDTIVVDKMDGVDIGDQIDIKDVLLVGSKKATMVGHPFVVGSKVLASVEEMAKDKKVITFKTRRRKASKRMRGFRRQITVLRIDDIVLTEDDQKIM